VIDGLKRLLFAAVDRFQNLAGPSGLFEAAQRYRSKRDFANAEECYSKAAKLYAKKHGNRDPRTVLSLAGQAHCLLALDRVREGREIYEKALDAKIANADRNRPTAEVLRERVEEARRRESS
jgi:tetratricopeptide (TPR) repeat protein